MPHLLTRLAALAAATTLVVSVSLTGPSAGLAAPRAAGSGSQYPQVWGDLVVFQDLSSRDLRSWDLSSGKTSTLPWASGKTAALGQTPSIWGSGASAESVSFFDLGFHVRSMEIGHAPSMVSSTAQASQTVRKWGQNLAWVDDRTVPQIWARSGSAAPVHVSSTGQWQGSPALYGSKLVWEDGRLAAGADIWFKDLASSAIPKNLSSVAGDQRYPSIWGNDVVWQDARDGKIASPDIYLYTLNDAGTGDDVSPDPSTTLSALLAIGGTTAHVNSTSGLEAGDWATVGGAADFEYLRVKQVDAPAGTVTFDLGASTEHSAGAALQVQGRQERPSMWADAAGNRWIVWQDSRKTRPDLPEYDIRLRAPDGSVQQLTNTQVLSGDPRDNTSHTRPQIHDDRIVWQNDDGTLGLYELRPHVYGEGAATAITDKVRVHASFGGHSASYRFGFGSSPGATDLSGGYTGSTTGSDAVLVGSSATPGPGEIAVPASSISLPAGGTYYVTVEVTAPGAGTTTVSSPAIVVDTVAPSAPSSLTSASAGGNVVLSWIAPSDAGSGVDHYRIRRSSSGEAESVIADTKDTSFTDDGTFGDAAAPIALTTYQYSVTAVDKAGNESGPAYVQATPKTPSQMTLTAAPARVTYPGTLLLTARLTAGSSAVPGGPTVTLMTRSASTNWAWVPAGTAQTSAAGLASWTTHPVVNAYWRASWQGGSTYGSSQSGDVYVAVLSKVTAKPSATRPSLRALLSVTGSVLPKHPRKYVYLQRYSGGRWRSLAHVLLSWGSAYRLQWRCSARGKLLLRVYFPDSDGRHLSSERRFYVTVR